jgi:hypothetical protein
LGEETQTDAEVSSDYCLKTFSYLLYLSVCLLCKFFVNLFVCKDLRFYVSMSMFGRTCLFVFLAFLEADCSNIVKYWMEFSRDEVVWSNNVLSKFIFFFRISFFRIFLILYVLSNKTSFEIIDFRKNVNRSNGLNYI